jgi:hypothetical protein
MTIRERETRLAFIDASWWIFVWKIRETRHSRWGM